MHKIMQTQKIAQPKKISIDGVTDVTLFLHLFRHYPAKLIRDLCKYLQLENQPSYGGLLSRSCGGLQPLVATEGHFVPEGILLDGRTDGRTTGLRELDNHLN